jgi:hypothetical protein
VLVDPPAADRAAAPSCRHRDRRLQGAAKRED